MLHIRPEQKKDFDAVHALVRDAFAAAEAADGDEQDFVVAMREHPGYMPDMALVAEKAGVLVGYILVTETHIERPDAEFPALLLAPLCVRKENRNQGVAGELMREAFSRGAAKGYGAIFLAGSPDYYHRFGFRSVRDFGISHQLLVPDKYILARELVPGALQGKTGTIILTGHTTCAPAMGRVSSPA